MNPVTDRSFGILIAYLLPGFLVVWALGTRSPMLTQWLAFDQQTAPTVGGFLYATLASLGVGLLLNTIRWALIDQIHYRTGLRPPRWDFTRLQENIDAFRAAVDFHYRYYQFYGATLIATIFLVAADAVGYTDLLPSPGAYLALMALIVLFFAASRDALAKYYRRTVSLSLPHLDSTRSSTMTNGSGPHEGSLASAADPKLSQSDSPTASSTQEAAPGSNLQPGGTQSKGTKEKKAPSDAR